MRKQFTGGVAALLTMLSMSVLSSSTGSGLPAGGALRLAAQARTAASPAATIGKVVTSGKVGTIGKAATSGSAKTVNQINTFAALAGIAAPDVEDSSAADYLSSVCGQGEYHWQEAKMPIKVCISSGAGVPGFRPEFSGMVRHAFNEWVAASGDKLSWKEVKSPAQADVNVGWTDQVTQRSNGTEAGETNAYTRLNRQTGQGIIYGAKMQLLTELPEKQFSDCDMEKTILHETGHALGLQGHSPVRTDIMYYAINADQQPALTQRDEATMSHLYAENPADQLAAKK